MSTLRAIETKAFGPARDFELSKRFYRDLGFTMASDGGGVASRLAQTYGVTLGPVELQPWRMRDFVLFDPSGVLWRVAQNV